MKRKKYSTISHITAEIQLSLYEGLPFQILDLVVMLLSVLSRLISHLHLLGITDLDILLLMNALGSLRYAF